ncbi:hypothetical protein [Stagnihabitans tardus]|nr:hypothetical protein [Stagnihabitans tardus]
MIGHNRGPQEGQGWHLHCWKRARADLLPTLPLEVVRLRVARAQALRLDYRTYASVRAATGHDVVAFLFSSNALRVSSGRIAPLRALHLTAVQAGRIGLAQGLAVAVLAENPELTSAHPAPAPFAPWGAARAAIRAALPGISGDRVILVGAAPWEKDWLSAGGLAAFLPEERYFPA